MTDSDSVFESPGSIFDEADIRSRINALDERIPREGARVIDQPGDEVGTAVAANQLGFLRLGVEMLQAAFRTPIESSTTSRVAVDIEYMLGGKPGCYSFHRVEDVDSFTGMESGTASGTLGCVVAGTIGLFVLASFVVGIVTIARWLYGLVF